MTVTRSSPSGGTVERVADEIYDVTWQDCTFGCRDNAGEYLDGGLSHHLLMQQGPPEHGPDGPRPNYASPAAYLGSPIPTGSYAVTHNMVEDGQGNLVDWWIRILAHAGLEPLESRRSRGGRGDRAVGLRHPHRRLRLLGSDDSHGQPGPPQRRLSQPVRLDAIGRPFICRLLRPVLATTMTTTTSRPTGTRRSRGSLPAPCPQACILGMTITDCWSTGDIRPELGYGGTFAGNTEDSNGTYAANVPSIVQTARCRAVRVLLTAKRMP